MKPHILIFQQIVKHFGTLDLCTELSVIIPLKAGGSVKGQND